MMEQTVNERVKLLITQLNLTADEFCEKADISRTTLWSIQKGAEMKPKTVKNICSAFNLSREWFLYGTGNQYEAPVSNNVIDPWKDALVMQLKEENNRLVEQARWLQNMVNQFTAGLKPASAKLRASENAYSFKLFPGVEQLGAVSGAYNA